MIRIYLAFFLSGAAALSFETIWFNQLGLALGNGVWSAALVAAAFMAGLGVGNYLIARHGHRVASPLHLYLTLEVFIACTGAGLVLFLPHAPVLLQPLFKPLLSFPAGLNFMRGLVAFAMLSLPATLMGATLPLLVRVLTGGKLTYGAGLGRLYGINTLGAVAGTLAAEKVAIPLLGMISCGLLAAMGNLLAVWLVYGQIARRPVTAIPQEPLFHWRQVGLRERRILAAAFISGGILLGLEVLWFRFLLLFNSGTSALFSLMLATVLTGIGLGGVLAGYCPSGWRRDRMIRWSSLLAGVLVALGLAGFKVGAPVYAIPLLLQAVMLMLPVSVLSGMLFTFLGTHLQRGLPGETSSTALLTLANTMGAMLGSLLAGLVGLPLMGLGATFLAVTLLYGLVMLLVPMDEPVRGWPRLAPALFGIGMVFFPHDITYDLYLPELAGRYGGRVVALSEGRSETAVYLEHSFLGEHLDYWLITNAHSMSSTATHAKRYMKLYVYLPVALHPQLKKALLISFGVGSTAKALTDTRSLETIHIVDISEDILNMGSISYADPRENPLADARVERFIEDGRYFLLSRDDRYDLITAEPPPPKNNGIFSLYSQEYFKLIHDRLNPGGITTYWLPVQQLFDREALAIIKAFCAQFEDCSLWNGYERNWMLMGSKGGIERPTEAHFARQWADPVVGPEMVRLGFEQVEQLGALFMADGPLLRDVAANTRALVDNFPRRLTSDYPPLDHKTPLQAFMMDTTLAQQRFAASPYIEKAWPAALREKSLPYFRYQRVINRLHSVDYVRKTPVFFADLADLLANSRLHHLVLWMLGSDWRYQEVVTTLGDGGRPDVVLHRLAGLLALRRFGEIDLVAGEELPQWQARLRAVVACLQQGRPDCGQWP